MSDDDDDVAAEEKRERAAKLARSQYEADVRAVMATPQGRRFVWSLVEKETASVFSGDALAMAHLDGKREVAKAIGAEVLRIDRRNYALMVAEWAKAVAGVVEEKPETD